MYCNRLSRQRYYASCNGLVWLIGCVIFSTKIEPCMKTAIALIQKKRQCDRFKPGMEPVKHNLVKQHLFAKKHATLQKSRQRLNTTNFCFNLLRNTIFKSAARD